MAERSAGHPELLARLREDIRAGGPISFARFMHEALYHPGVGYYARGPQGLGSAGDFFTASDVGVGFGRALARQLAEMDVLLGRPETFRYVEFAAGRGLLARDVLDAARERHRGLGSRLRAILVDASDGMRTVAARAVPEAEVASPDAVSTGDAGCVVAVELLDALPVHRVRRRAGRLVEVRVGLDAGDLVEVEGDADPDVEAWAERYGAAPEEGDEAEASLELAPALGRMARTIDRGFVLVVDYGDASARLYGRRRGTLLAYHRHATSEDLLARVGEQDLTAHVNFDALSDAAAACGLTSLGLTTQDRFLIANGLLEGIEEDRRDLEATKRRLQAKQLIHPAGMGRIFKVAIFVKGVVPVPALRGLSDPFPS